MAERALIYICLQEVIAQNRFLDKQAQKLSNQITGEIDWRQLESTADMRIFEGTARIGGQEHFYFEPHSCLVIPGERDVLNVYSSTQSASQIQASILLCLILIVVTRM